MKPITPHPNLPQLSDLLAIAQLSLQLGEVNRATQHPDGRPESDTTHTVHLALLATCLAPLSDLALDVGMVTQFALVHDLVEAYAGDTNTARGLTAEQRAEKEAREAAALERIREELVAFPWVVEMIERYEAQEEPEARFVRYLDKVVCKHTHILNSGSALRAIGMSTAEMYTKHARQGWALFKQYPELTLVAQVFDQACDACEERLQLDEPAAEEREEPTAAERFAAEHDHPSRYQPGPYEAIKVIEAWGAGFCVGNALKYLCRHPHKGTPEDDLRKALWYCERACEQYCHQHRDQYSLSHAELLEAHETMNPLAVVDAWKLTDTFAGAAVRHLAFGDIHDAAQAIRDHLAQTTLPFAA